MDCVARPKQGCLAESATLFYKYLRASMTGATPALWSLLVLAWDAVCPMAAGSPAGPPVAALVCVQPR